MRISKGRCRVCRAKDVVLNEKELCPVCATAFKKNSRKNPAFKAARFEIDNMMADRKKHIPHGFGWVL